MTKERPSFPLKLDSLETKKSLANRAASALAPAQIKTGLPNLKAQDAKAPKNIFLFIL